MLFAVGYALLVVAHALCCWLSDVRWLNLDYLLAVAVCCCCLFGCLRVCVWVYVCMQVCVCV